MPTSAACIGLFGLFLALRREAELLAELDQREDDDHRRHDVRAALRHEARGLVVDQRAVLDAAHAELDRAPDRTRGMAMRRGVRATLRRLVDDRAHLVLAILVHPDRVGGRCDAARAHDLDAVRAAAKFLAHGLQALVDAVRHHGTRVVVAARAHNRGCGGFPTSGESRRDHRSSRGPCRRRRTAGRVSIRPRARARGS